MTDADNERQTLQIEYEFLTVAMRRTNDRVYAGPTLNEADIKKSRELVARSKKIWARINHLRLMQGC